MSIEHEEETTAARQDEDVVYDVWRPLTAETDFPTISTNCEKACNSQTAERL